MTQHDPIYAIAQKIWEAAYKFALESVVAVEEHHSTLPAAYPIITPLVQELTAYVDQQIAAERGACATIAEKYIDHVASTGAPSVIAGVAHMIAYHIRARSIPLPYDGEDGG